MNERRQIGPTLFFQISQPTVGDHFATPSGVVEVLEIIASPEDGGWLFIVGPSRP